MKNILVTVSREFGCSARGVTRQFAEEMGLPFYDKDLIDETARRLGVSPESFSDVEGDIEGVSKGNLVKVFGYGSDSLFYSDAAIRMQGEVISDLAEKGSGVFFGRCADYFLSDHENCISIFLYAPLDARIKHIANDYDLTLKKAEALIKRVDRQRHNYYKYVTGHNRGDRYYKKLMLDVNFFGKESTISLMKHACREMGFEPET